MNALEPLQQWFRRNAGWAGGLAAPMLVITILSMMVLPLPPWLLDTFFTLNIALALIVMMVAAYMQRPLDFSVFPTVLLLTTLLRLSLNVASTRVVLLEGHTGPGAAGQVIEAFGHFLIGGNFAVGFVVFVILVVINFVVITKGSERIAEVSARFTLDAMPGKQMAIDADLGAGLIDEKEAKRRRAEVGEEAEFFGSMDGASKFVRGDAIAGILILIINIVGGLIIGMVQHGLSAGQAADSYILLAVGDALVAQIPSLLISVAAAMVVSRVGKGEDLGGQVVEQMFLSTRVLGVTAGVLFLLGALVMVYNCWMTILGRVRDHWDTGNSADPLRGPGDGTGLFQRHERRDLGEKLVARLGPADRGRVTPNLSIDRASALYGGEVVHQSVLGLADVEAVEADHPALRLPTGGEGGDGHGAGLDDGGGG